MFKRAILPFVILLIAILVFWALKASKPEKALVDKPEKVWRVSTIAVSYQDIAPELTLYGRVETPRLARLNAAVTSDVQRVTILEGSIVDAGEVLVQLDNSDVSLVIEQRQADVAEIEALITSEILRYQRDKDVLSYQKQLLALTEKEVQRALTLQQKKLVSQSNLDETRADKERQLVTVKTLEHDIREHPSRLAGLKARLSRAQALLGQAKLDLARTMIEAPFAGRVAKLNVAVGDRVRNGDALLTLYDLSHLEVRAQLPMRYLKQIRDSLATGNAVLAEGIVNEQKLRFELSRLSGEVQQNSGGIDGLFKLVSQSDVALTLGAFVELTLLLQPEHDVISIPFNALYGLDRVYRINDGYLEAVKVKRVGEYRDKRGENRLLIRSDALHKNDRIVSTQLPNAITGLRVEANEDGL